MKVYRLTFGSFGINTYVVADPSTKECAVIDPGMMTPAERVQIDAFIAQEGLKPVSLINTHMHIDHVMGNAHMAEKYGLKLQANKEDKFLGKRVEEQAQMFGLPESPNAVSITTYLSNGDIIPVGQGRLKVLEVPGHSPGSIALYDEKDGFVITGDALFQGSIGRTDLPGGNHPQLLQAIRRQLFSLPDATVVYPGHGPSTTIGQEKSTNPFF